MHPLKPVANSDAAFLYKKLFEFLDGYSTGTPLLFPVITYLLLFSQSLQLNRLINVNRMMQRTTYLPAVAYLVTTSLLPEWNIFSPSLIANTFVLLVFNSLFSLYNEQRVKGTVYNIGLCAGVSSFFFFPALTLFIWVIFGLLVMRPVRVNEWLVCLLGVTTPFYLYAAWLFLNDQWSWENLIKPVSVSVPHVVQSAWLAGAGLLLVIPFLVGGYYVQDNLRRMLIQVRKNWSLFLIYLLFALFVPFLDKNPGSLENWILVVIPFASFHACAYLYPPRRWFPTIIFWASVLFILAYQYFGTGW